MMPDLLAYFLTGRKCCERSIAITTQLYDPHQGNWCKKLFDIFDLPISIMPEIVDPGTILGELDASIKESVGLKSAPVIAPCSHDTPSAVAAVPSTQQEDWGFISSGTWSVTGALSDKVVTESSAYENNLITELGVDGFFLCSNIMGLWLLQRARAVWQGQGQEYSYQELVKLAGAASENGPLVFPNDPGFLAPDNMCQAIQEFCKKTGQEVPQTPGQISRCILESLAFCYNDVFSHVKRILGRDFSKINIVGGGSLNSLLCQFTANATGVPVEAGPSEATIAGNILVQALACGHIGSTTEIRQIIRESFELRQYEPQDTKNRQNRFEQYLGFMQEAKKN